MKDRTFVVLLVVASLLIKIPIALFFLQGFGIDESLYLATARDYAETGEFGIKTEFNDFRFIAPLLAFVMAGFYKAFGEVGPLLVSPIMGSLAIIPMFFLGKLALGEKAGRLAAALVAVNPAFFLLNTRPLTESVAFLLLVSGILLFFLALREKKYWMFVLPVLLVTFLARYPYGFLLAVFFAAALLFEKKLKSVANYNMLIGVGLAVLIAAPWFLFNYESYGTLIGGPVHQGSTDVGFDYTRATWYVPYMLIVAGATFPLMIYGMMKNFHDRKLLFFLGGFFVVFLVQFFVFGKSVEERYILPILPFATILAVSGYEQLLKWNKRTKYVLVAMVALNIIAAAYLVDTFSVLPKYSETYDALAWMKGNCGPVIFGNVFTPTYNALGTSVIPPAFDQTADSQTIRDREVDCAIVSEHESPYADFFVDEYDSEKVSFGKVHVYKIK
jgi:4-amino-4-deoxy-L-arabinose transferase-like glycosyltransferase